MENLETRNHSGRQGRDDRPQTTRKLLIVDDEPNVLYSFGKGLRQEHLQILTAETGTEALNTFSRESPDTVILDVKLPDMSGLEVFDRFHEIDAQIPVIMVTAHSTTEIAIDAMKRGAFDYVPKPADIHQLRSLVSRALELAQFRRSSITEEHSTGDEADQWIVGHSRAMQEVYKTIGRVAAEDVTVLILGESGTGKELVAKAIYQHSRRNTGPFLTINCAAIPESLLESELFGHEQGAFTGADRQRIGKFEQADGGTLFLDELGDMTPATQAKVLRVLQDGCFQRVGGQTTIRTDVRVVAATNQNLEQKIDSGEFRSDLLYRLNGFTIHLPPLRERLDDLPPLVEHFLRIANQDIRRPVQQVAPEAWTLLKNYHWPGNVRELQSVVTYAVVHAVGDVITPECLPPSCRNRDVAHSDDSNMVPRELTGLAHRARVLFEQGESDIYRILSNDVDRIVLSEILKQVRGNQVHASQRLGMSRTTLRSKMAQHGLDSDDFTV